MIRIEINGIEVEVPQGSMVIEAADQLNIEIPRFCYHNKLSIAANCRMCLVEIEKAPKALPACATPVTEGMKVWTHSAKAIEAQRAIMEFLLINHPLDCPICDQGGECELQDVSMGYGQGIARFNEGKRVVADKDLGSLIQTDLTRCIHCTRCVRFGQEVAGIRELGATGRGEATTIGTYIEQSVDSEISGNVIDLCPVGALTSKPFRYQARSWELSQHNGVSVHDCIGSNIYLHVRRGDIMRVVPRAQEKVNEVWLSDRDRFSYEGLASEDRLSQPLRKQGTRWVKVSWSEALNYANEKIQALVQASGGKSLGALISPTRSLEEQYIFQKYFRALGCNNIDHRLRQQDYSTQEASPLYPSLGVTIEDLEHQDAVLLVGCHLHKEQPIAGIKVRKMVMHGGQVGVINPFMVTFNFDVKEHIVPVDGDLVMTLAGVAKAIIDKTSGALPDGAKKLLEGIKPSGPEQQLAEMLMVQKKTTIVLGQLSLMHPQFGTLQMLSYLIAECVKGTFGYFSDGGNAAGAWMTGCVPHRLPADVPVKRPGKTAYEMLNDPLKGYCLFGFDPGLDTLLGEVAVETLKQADFVMSLSSYASETLKAVSDLILPIAPYTEVTGTYVNIDGRWQSMQAVVEPMENSRPAWKVLRVLGNLAELEGFSYNSAQDILQEIQESVNEGRTSGKLAWQWVCPKKLTLPTPKSTTEKYRYLPVLSLYASDDIVRRSPALQKTKDALSQVVAYLHSIAADSLKLQAGDWLLLETERGTVELPLVLSDQVPEDSVVIPMAKPETMALGKPYSFVEISKVLRK